MVNKDTVLCVGQTVAQITAQFSPLPHVLPAVQMLCGIIELCESVKVNRHAAFQLRDRCYFLLFDFTDGGKSSAKIAGAVDDIQSTLNLVKRKMIVLAQKTRWQAMIEHKTIECDIKECHTAIENCLSKFNVTSQVEIHRWQQDFEINARKDHDEVIERLKEMSDNQSAMKEGMAHIEEVMTMLQNNGLKDNRLQSNLYELQMETKTLLPDHNLKHGEVVRIGQDPIDGTETMDIWKGLYLDREFVTMKKLRAAHSNAKSIERFEREVSIWSNVWKQDQGKHVLPFYGFIQTDASTCVVSPWQSNGTAIAYVKANADTVDYRKLILGIAKGIKVLHMQNPPVVHGDIKGINIVIADDGRPLLADFGVSKIMEDIAGVPLTQSRGGPESYRWSAPELCTDPGILSTRSDIYAFAMTTMELLTHQKPLAHIKLHTDAVMKSMQGERPKRPTDLVIVQRGLDDNLWNLLNRCWDMDAGKRPDIHQVLAELS